MLHLEEQNCTLDDIRDTLESNGREQETANLIAMLRIYRDQGDNTKANKLELLIENRMGMRELNITHFRP